MSRKVWKSLNIAPPPHPLPPKEANIKVLFKQQAHHPRSWITHQRDKLHDVCTCGSCALVYVGHKWSKFAHGKISAFKRTWKGICHAICPSTCANLKGRSADSSPSVLVLDTVPHLFVFFFFFFSRSFNAHSVIEVPSPSATGPLYPLLSLDLTSFPLLPFFFLFCLPSSFVMRLSSLLLCCNPLTVYISPFFVIPSTPTPKSVLGPQLYL